MGILKELWSRLTQSSAILEKREPKLIEDNAPSEGGQAFAAKVALVKKSVETFERSKPVLMAMDADGKDCVPADSFKDEWGMGSPVAGDALLGWFAAQFFLGYPMLAFISQNWLVQKACSMPARDAVRHGFERSIAGIDDADKKNEAGKLLDTLDKEFGLLEHCEDFVRLGRVFGLRILFFDFKFKTDLERKEWYAAPFNLDGVTEDSYVGIKQVDPIWCKPMPSAENLTDPSKPHFYEPDFWMIGQTKFHRTHLVFFRTSEVPDILKPSYNFGGVSVPQKIYERVYNAERTANEAPALAMTKRLVVWKTDTETTLANWEMTQKHLSNLAHMRDNFGVHMIDTDDDTSQLETNLTGFDDVVMNQFQLVAAAADVPATKLLGTTPKGFQSTGESETRSYHEELETIQSNDLSPLIDWHYQIAARSTLPSLGINPAGVTISHSWNGVDSPTESETAETQKLKTERDDILIMNGTITAEEARSRISQDKNSGYFGLPLTSGDLSDADKDEVDKTVAELENLENEEADAN